MSAKSLRRPIHLWHHPCSSARAVTREQRVRSQGFTLMEMIVVMALIAIAALIGFPALQKMIHRAKIMATVTQIATEARAARLESVKNSVQYYLQADYSNNRIAIYAENGAASGFNPATDTFVRAVALPRDLTVNTTYGLPADGHIGFKPDGTSDVDPTLGAYGAFRFGDSVGNVLEVKVDAGPARVQIRKFDGTAYRVQGELGKSWSWKT
jgi:prepilin-type N-terminal cleavage/methylation domain-containing protein